MQERVALVGGTFEVESRPGGGTTLFIHIPLRDEGRRPIMAELRIFIADDHAIVREGLKSLVNAQPEMQVVGEAGDGHAAYQGIVELRPDVAVMDLSMPGLSGAQATEHLKRSCPEIKVVALTVHEDESYLRGLLEAGAVGYILKRSAAEELIHAIRTVAAGGVYLDPSLAGKLVSVYIDDRSIASRPTRASSPTARPRWCASSRWGTATRKSPPVSASASRRWRPTRPARWRSWAYTAAPTSCATPCNTAG